MTPFVPSASPSVGVTSTAFHAFAHDEPVGAAHTDVMETADQPEGIVMLAEPSPWLVRLVIVYVYDPTEPPLAVVGEIVAL